MTTKTWHEKAILKFPDLTTQTCAALGGDIFVADLKKCDDIELYFEEMDLDKIDEPDDVPRDSFSLTDFYEHEFDFEEDPGPIAFSLLYRKFITYKKVRVYHTGPEVIATPRFFNNEKMHRRDRRFQHAECVTRDVPISIDDNGDAMDINKYPKRFASKIDEHLRKFIIEVTDGYVFLDSLKYIPESLKNSLLFL